MTLLSSYSLVCNYNKVFVQESYQQVVGKNVSWQAVFTFGGIQSHLCGLYCRSQLIGGTKTFRSVYSTATVGQDLSAGTVELVILPISYKLLTLVRSIITTSRQNVLVL